MRKHMIPFSTTQEGDRELIELAFSKKKADERKEWLRQCKVYLLLLAYRTLVAEDFSSRVLSSTTRWKRSLSPTSSTRS